MSVLCILIRIQTPDQGHFTLSIMHWFWCIGSVLIYIKTIVLMCRFCITVPNNCQLVHYGQEEVMQAITNITEPEYERIIQSLPQSPPSQQPPPQPTLGSSATTQHAKSLTYHHSRQADKAESLRTQARHCLGRQTWSQ